jgi:hypothetical protein
VWVEFAHSVVAVCIDCIVATERVRTGLQCRSGHRPTPRLCTPRSLIHPHSQPSRDGARHVSVILRRVSLYCATDVVAAAQHSCVWPKTIVTRRSKRESYIIFELLLADADASLWLPSSHLAELQLSLSTHSKQQAFMSSLQRNAARRVVCRFVSVRSSSRTHTRHSLPADLCHLRFHSPPSQNTLRAATSAYSNVTVGLLATLVTLCVGTHASTHVTLLCSSFARRDGSTLPFLSSSCHVVFDLLRARHCRHAIVITLLLARMRSCQQQTHRLVSSCTDMLPLVQTSTFATTSSEWVHADCCSGPRNSHTARPSIPIHNLFSPACPPLSTHSPGDPPTSSSSPIRPPISHLVGQ